MGLTQKYISLRNFFCLIHSSSSINITSSFFTEFRPNGGAGTITHYCVQWQLVLHETSIACNTWDCTYMYWKTATVKVTHSHSHRKTSEFTKWKRKTINVYISTKFHLVVDAQGSTNISQKTFFSLGNIGWQL